MWGLGGAHPPAPSEQEGEGGGGGNREDEGAVSAEMGAGMEGVV